MPRIWIFSLLIACSIGSGDALAQSHPCNVEQVHEQLASTGQVPNLRGCAPDEVRPILQHYDYGLTIENRIVSQTVREGRIVSQRMQSSNVYVDVSTGPSSTSSDERRRRNTDLLFDFLEGVSRVMTSVPPPAPPPQVSDPGHAPPAPPSEDPVPVLEQPPRQAPTAPPPPPAVVQPPSAPPPPAAQPTAPAESAAAPPAPQPAATTNQLGTQVQRSLATQAIIPASGLPADIQPRPTEEIVPPPAERPVIVPPIIPPTPVSRFFLQGISTAREGDELILTIRREGRDRLSHRLELAYSDHSLLVSPPPTLEYGAALPDEVDFRLQTAVTKGEGDRRLLVRLANAGRAEVGQPDSVTAVILDRKPWWEKLLQTLAALPAWTVALAAATAAAAVSMVLIPRASCSIRMGSVDLGAAPLKARWPALRVQTMIGKPSYSVPIPLPIARRKDAELSPA